MGLHWHISQQNSRNCPSLSRRSGTCMPDPYPHHFNRYGKTFTDRLFGVRGRPATWQRAFDTLCSTLGIEHRLTPPRSPQTNGMVERFNGRIEQVLQSHHFRSGEELETTLQRYVWLYNHQFPQSGISNKMPLKTMKQWHKIKPELFKKQLYYHTACDT